jgi:hypothetical protein
MRTYTTHPKSGVHHLSRCCPGQYALGERHPHGLPRLRHGRLGFVSGGSNTDQNLIITKGGQPEIAVDNLEIAQFVYLLLNNKKIREVIDTIGKKGVCWADSPTPGSPSLSCSVMNSGNGVSSR